MEKKQETGEEEKERRKEERKQIRKEAKKVRRRGSEITILRSVDFTQKYVA